MSKYHAQKTFYKGHKYDSKKEAKRAEELSAMEAMGDIKNLRRQVKFELIPSQYIDGKCVERACNYFADFVYEVNGKTIAEDVKGFKTPDYIIKRKLLLQKFGLRIHEV